MLSVFSEKMRKLYGMIFVFCSLSCSSDLKLKYKDNFSEDIVMQLKKSMLDDNVSLYQEKIENFCISLFWI